MVKFNDNNCVTNLEQHRPCIISVDHAGC